jgi:hypothetical protein
MKRSLGRPRSGGYVGLLLLLITVAIILILYFSASGPGGKSYVEQTQSAREQAEAVTSNVNLDSVWKSIRIYAAANDEKFPKTPEELIRAAGLPDGFLFCPSRPKDPYQFIYIGGQNDSMPPANVLIYQAATPPGGQCQVLRLDGRMELLSYQEAAAAINKTASYVQ